MPNRKQRRAAAAVARRTPKPKLAGHRLTLTAGRAVRAQGQPRRLSVVAYNGGIMSVDGFGAIVIDLTGIEIPPSLPILADHENKLAAVIGAGAPSNDGKAISLAVTVAASPAGENVIALLESGTGLQASVGADVVESRPVREGESVTVNGRTLSGPFELITRSVLKETTITPLGADSSTSVQLAARRSRPSVRAAAMSFEEFVAQYAAIFKVDPASLDETQTAAMNLAYSQMTGGTAPPAPGTEPASPTEDTPETEASDDMTDEENVTATDPEEETPVAARNRTPAVRAAARTPAARTNATDPVEAMNRRVAANIERVNRITEICAEYGNPSYMVNGREVPLNVHAIRAGWNADKAHLEALRASRPQVSPAPLGGSRLPAGVQASRVIEAALCKSLGQKDREKSFKPVELEAADGQQFRNLTIGRTVMIAAAANGYPSSPGERLHAGNLRDVLAHAFPRIKAAGGSTLSLPGILSNVANKEILAGYMQEDNSWREIAAIKSVVDFKQVTSYRMLDDMEYEEIGADGGIKHGSTGEESYTRQAKTYAKMYSLTRRDLINDDLGAFADIQPRVGRGGAKKLVKVFWTAFINNSSFFTTARTNYISGSTTNLGTDGVGLGLGVKAFRQMTSPSADGSKHVNADTQNPVGGSPGGRPEILLVPPELEGIAEALYRNQNLGTVATSSANIYANKYRPVVAWQLSDTGYTGYSTTAWYLFNSPGLMAPMVVSFLNGNETPTVETADADFDQLAVLFRGYHDFGCDQAEYLAGLKSKGAA